MNETAPLKRPLVPGLISVMMPVYNAAAYIPHAIQSVLAQTYPLWELIIVDDGSTDGSGDAAAAFSDPRVRLYRQPNGGEASARNRALQESRGEFIAFLDADDLFLPQHLSQLAGAFQHSPEMQGIYCDGMYMDATENDLEPLSSRRRGPFSGDLYGELVRASDVFGPPICTLLRHETILQHQLTFDTRIVIGPDWDFFTRFAAHGRFAYLDLITCRYRLHQGSISAVTNNAKRRQSLAICREKAVLSPRFDTLSEATCAYALYDLLIELIPGEAARQEQITHWPQFLALSPKQQARLLRLTAVQSLRRGTDTAQAGQWLARARRIYPADWRAWLLTFAQFLPGVSRSLLIRERK